VTELTPQIKVMVQNDSGKDIPPRSVVVVAYDEVVAATTENEPITIVHVMQYNGQAGNILVTGDSTIYAASGIQPRVPTTGWWSQANSYGVAYSDQRLYVSIDQAISLPVPGEEWGPVSGQWYITRGGKGFFADGYYQAPGSTGSGSSGTVDTNSGVDGNGGLDNVDPSRAIFMRGTPWKKNWGMVVSNLTSGTLSAPTTCLVDVWLPDTTSSASPVPYVRATNNALLGMTVTNRGCYNSNPTSGSGAGSGSDSSGPIPCRIEYDHDAQEWYLAWLGRCITVATNVSCNSSGLTVTYRSVTG